VYERVPLQNPGSSTRSSIWIYSFQKQQSQQASAESHIAAYPAWSTSGLLAFYDSNLQAYQVIHPEQGQVLSFTNQTGKPGIWQPDSQGFVALEVLIETSGLLDPGGTSHLMHYALADSGIVLKDLSQAYDLEDKDPAFSPDGSKLAFSRRYLDPARWTPGRQLWVMHTDGSQAEPLTEEPAFHHYAFTWHPDGAQIAYVRFDPTLLTHPPELWLIDVDGSNPIQLVIGGFAPAWMP
jgi:Tol biopolymer transport system component